MPSVTLILLYGTSLLALGSIVAGVWSMFRPSLVYVQRILFANSIMYFLGTLLALLVLS